MNNVDAVNCGHIGAGDQLPEQKPTVTTTSWSTTHFESINTKLQLTESSDLENKDKIIMGVAVISSLLVLILVYSAVIRPYSMVHTGNGRQPHRQWNRLIHHVRLWTLLLDPQ